MAELIFFTPRYSSEAVRQLREIAAYIRKRNPTAALTVSARLKASANRLSVFPQLGRPGSVTGTREWTVSGLPYKITYEVDGPGQTLLILAVYHTAQQRP